MILFSQASENLGMANAMIYTLVLSAKDWLSEHYGQDDGADYAKQDEVLFSAQYYQMY